MITIDGSTGEGGGQIIRTALALSVLTDQPFTITRIRAGRPNPGLQRQHLTAVKAVAELFDATTEGASVGSTTITFSPGDIKPGTYRWDIGSAGSVTLVLQALLPAALYARHAFTFTITGGTNVPWSPPVEYFEHVFCSALERMGAQLQFCV